MNKYILIAVMVGSFSQSSLRAQSGWYGDVGGGLVNVHGLDFSATTLPLAGGSAPAGSNSLSVVTPSGGTTGTVTIFTTTSAPIANGPVTIVSFSPTVATEILAADRVTNRPIGSLVGAFGYHFNSYLACEIDYEQPSAIHTTSTVDFSPNAGSLTVNREFKIQNLGVVAIGSYPLTANVRLYAGGGIASSWEKAKTGLVVVGPQAGLSGPIAGYSDQSWRAELRAGIEVAVSRRAAVRLGWDRPDANLHSWQGYNPVGQITLDDFAGSVLWSF